LRCERDVLFLGDRVSGVLSLGFNWTQTQYTHSRRVYALLDAERARRIDFRAGGCFRGFAKFTVTPHSCTLSNRGGTHKFALLTH